MQPDSTGSEVHIAPLRSGALADALAIIELAGRRVPRKVRGERIQLRVAD
jgi:hypothetical protein